MAVPAVPNSLFSKAMQYDNSSVRRQDRLLAEDRALEILREGEYGFLAFGNETGGYGIPVNYVYCDDGCCYFHCAPEGEKLRWMARNPQVTFCVVGHTAPCPERFTTEYESVLLTGRLERVTDDDERMHALSLIVGKYAPQFRETGMKYAQGSFHRTAILRLTAECCSGKCKYLPASKIATE